MGFFDKIKNAVNKITGGGATVTIAITGDKLDQPIKVDITAVVKDAPLEISKVYLRVKSAELVSIPKKELPGDNQNFDLNLEKEMYKVEEFVVAQAQTLEAKQTYNWSYEITLKPNLNPRPTYIGQYVSHEWLFYAGLDAKGNDPDSGWQSHELK